MNVAIAQGVALSDESARRFSVRMLESLRGYNDRAAMAMDACLDKGASIGNPKGLRRLFSRIVKAMGPTYLQGSLVPGKKGVFRFDYTTFIADAREGLFIASVTFKGNGTAKPGAQAFDLLSFTNHALIRLIQRAGFRSTDDYMPLLKALATPSLLCAAAVGFNKGIPAGGAWPLPVRVNGQRVLLLIKAAEEHPVPAAITVYKGEWRNFPAVTRLEEMLSVDVLDPNRNWEGVEPYRDAFVAAAKHFRRTNHA